MNSRTIQYSKAGRRRGQTGQAALFMTFSLMALLGMVGLVVDVGWAYWRKEACKAAAQAAVQAAAVAAKTYSSCNTGGIVCQAETACSVTPTNSTNLGSGCLYAKQNGFVNQGNQIVTMQAGSGSPPVTGVVADYWIIATVGENIPQLFSAVLGSPWAKVRARSVAAVYKPPIGACIYALGPTGVGLRVTGTVNVYSTCGIYVNSSDPSAFTGGGSSVINATKISVVGGYDPNGGTSVSPTPITGVTPTFDPLARVAQPVVPNRCDSNGLSENSNITMPSDGIFVVCGGYNINSNKTVTIPAGTYVFTSGSIDWKNGTLKATGGVTFFMTGTFTGISINGNVTTDLSAPTSGPLEGMLFFQDRSHPVSAALNGGSGLHMNGTLYFPTSDISFSGGNSTTNNYIGIVAHSVNFPGTSYLSGDSTGFYTGIGLPSASIVE